MAYDPMNDPILRCACQPDEDEYARDGGWDEYFNELVAQQFEIMKEESGFCPRSMVRHAAARLAAMIAMVSVARIEEEAAQSAETILAHMPDMLRDMVAVAGEQLSANFEKELRGAAAGFRKSLN